METRLRCSDQYKTEILGAFLNRGEPGLVDRVLALHTGSRGFDSHRGHMSKRFSRSNRPGYPLPVNSELENSSIRMAVGDCSVTERRRWRSPYQTGKTVHVHAKHYKHNEDGRTVPGVCGNGSVPLSHSGNVVTKIGIHTLTFLSHSGNVVTRIGIHTHTHTHARTHTHTELFDRGTCPNDFSDPLDQDIRTQ